MPEVNMHISAEEQVKKWSRELNCSEGIFRHCLSRVGASLPAIKMYLSMNRDRLSIQYNERAWPNNQRRA